MLLLAAAQSLGNFGKLMEKRLTKIELFKERMGFSAGHFTIFSETERENLHGHRFSVYVAIEAEVLENGMTFDYGNYKKAIIELCDSLDEVVLIAADNPAIKIEETKDYIYILFDHGKEKIPFLRRDIKLLSLRNITVEELSYWFLQNLITYIETRPQDCIYSIEVKVFSGLGQSGSSFWKKP